MMIKKLAIAAVMLSFAGAAGAQIKVGGVLQKGKEMAGKTSTGNSSLSKDEVVAGLKEALTRGAELSSKAAAVTDGFNGNALIRIPFPPEAQNMKERLIKIGMQKKVEEFELSVNRAAEEAAKEAYPIFVDAVKSMSVSDGFAILNGGDTAATHFLRQTTTAPLTTKFTPVVKAAMDKVQVTAYWNPLVTSYNKIPGVQKQNPDLEAYVTAKAIDGLMKLIAQEEAKIRKDPAAQVSDLLKKVFGGK
jgi:hypothetical protein